MSTTLYHFTGTGNSLYITNMIASELSETTLVPINTIDFSKKIAPTTDIVGVIYPTYFLDAPEIITEFLEKLEVPDTTYFFLYSNYGQTLGNAIYNPYQLLKKKGMTVNATFHVVLPDNSIIFPTKPEDQPKMLLSAKEKIKEHALKIANKENLETPKKSHLYKVASSLMKSISKYYLGLNNIEINAKKCTNCGLCIKVCSKSNITSGDNTPIVKDQCSMCFSCIHYCPQMATRFRRMKPLENYQYHHPEISINDIIATRR